MAEKKKKIAKKKAVKKKIAKKPANKKPLKKPLTPDTKRRRAKQRNLTVTKAPQLNDEQRAWVVSMLGAYYSRAVIYAQITDKEFERKHGFKGISTNYMSYTQFRDRCLKIKSTEIEVAHNKWVEDWEGVPFATTKGRVVALSDLIDLLREKTPDGQHDLYYLPDIVGDIRMIIREIRNEMDAESEREAKAKSGTNIYIGKTLMDMDISPEMMVDTFTALCKEYGLAILGLENWAVEKLNQLRSHIDEIITEKEKIIDAEYSVEGETDEN